MKLTALQSVVLRDAKAGHVYRSERGLDLYDCYDRAQGANKKVTAIVKRLYDLGMLSIGPREGLERPWLVTAQGNQVLAQTEKTS